MMHEFLSANRSEIEQRYRHKILGRTRRMVDQQRLERGVPVFLDQIINALRAESELYGPKAHAIAESAANDASRPPEKMKWPTVHGTDSLPRSIDLVVQDYADICQAIVDLAIDLGEEIEIAELRTLDRCLDSGIADAVTEFSQGPALVVADELRDSLNTATLALIAIKSGNWGMSGATGAVLDRSLTGLRSFINQSQAEIRVETGMKMHRSVFILADFIDEMKYSASAEAELHECVLNIENVPRLLMLNVDKDLLLSALGNLLQNAYKFSGKSGTVTLSVSASVDRIQIAVESRDCSFSEYVIDDMFLPFTQSGANKIGMGMGLSLARRNVEANGGLLTVDSEFGQGCKFTIDFPRKAISVEDFSQE
jgi:signal transduction histidine kinase